MESYHRASICTKLVSLNGLGSKKHQKMAISDKNIFQGKVKKVSKPKNAFYLSEILGHYGENHA
ncbi:hypothetical protein APH_0666 [Anaplasma phagocytophilum str. HZ]|uniref:Uncharacterized protein n=3 Tax=Anaplasma phagocytophilum TaxID=948 RepID=Q2GK53_ANAPZ|nr:hypothetical protein APH_0666 [Anaplasma phagocytophilum str. HZ]